MSISIRNLVTQTMSSSRVILTSDDIDSKSFKLGASSLQHFLSDNLPAASTHSDLGSLSSKYISGNTYPNSKITIDNTDNKILFNVTSGDPILDLGSTSNTVTIKGTFESSSPTFDVEMSTNIQNKFGNKRINVDNALGTTNGSKQVNFTGDNVDGVSFMHNPASSTNYLQRIELIPRGNVGYYASIITPNQVKDVWISCTLSNIYPDSIYLYNAAANSEARYISVIDGYHTITFNGRSVNKFTNHGGIYSIRFQRITDSLEILMDTFMYPRDGSWKYTSINYCGFHMIPEGEYRIQTKQYTSSFNCNQSGHITIARIH